MIKIKNVIPKISFSTSNNKGNKRITTVLDITKILN